jgi:CPA1 family monovalent cation:H+ antiporter
VAQPVSARWQHVLTWSGLRGAISLALALTLPGTLGADRQVLWVMAYGVVLFTLLVQGTTMRPLLRRLQINTRSPAHEAYELSHARLTSLRAAEKHLDNLHRQGMISTPAWEKLRPRLDKQVSTLATEVRQVLAGQPAVEAEELDTAWRELLRAQRSALWGLRQDGVISDEVCEQLTAEVDGQLHANDALPPPEAGNSPGTDGTSLTSPSPPVE